MKDKSSHLVATEVNPGGEPVTGFCPFCFSVNVYRDVTDRDWKVWRMFRGLPYYCMDCRKAFEKLAEDYIPKAAEDNPGYSGDPNQIGGA